MKIVRGIAALLIGLILILAGARGLLLLAVGEETTGIITDVSRYRGHGSDSATDHDYKITYEFTDKDGKQITGSYMEYKVYNITSLPGTGKLISVRYLSIYSGLSFPASEPPISWRELLAVLGGIALIIGNGLFGRRKPAAAPQPVYAQAVPTSSGQVPSPQQPSGGFCAECGAALRPDAAFCPGCGKRRG